MGEKIKVPREKFLRTLAAASERRVPSRSYIANLYPWHCRESVSALVRFAFMRQNSNPKNVSVRILVHTFLDNVFGEETVTDFQNYLIHSGSIKILFAQPPVANYGGTFNELKSVSENLARERGRQSGLQVQTTPLIDRPFPQFILVGEAAYRVEATHDPIYDPSEFKARSPELPARLCFNDPRGGRQLMASFDLLWRVAADKDGGRNMLREVARVFAGV